MAETLHFIKGSTDYTIKTQKWPYDFPNMPVQKKGMSVGLSVKVAKVTDEKQTFNLNFARLTDTEETNLRSFFITDVDYYMETFTFTDYDSTNYTVRLWKINKWLQMVTPGRWEFDITLREE